MEKINELIDKLQELKKNNADLTTLSHYTQLLYAEIARLKTAEAIGQATQINVSVILPSGVAFHAAPAPEAAQHRSDAIPAVPAGFEAGSPLPPAAAVRTAGPKAKPVAATLFEASEAKVPLAAAAAAVKKEVNEAIGISLTSLNETLREQKTELGEKLSGTPVNDLRSAIGINDKFLFVTELFKEDINMYERSVKTINAFPTLREAENWIERELRLKLGWTEQNHVVQTFYATVRKRFS